MGPLFDTGINAVIPSQRAIPATLMDPNQEPQPDVVSDGQYRGIHHEGEITGPADRPDGYIVKAQAIIFHCQRWKGDHARRPQYSARYQPGIYF